VVICLWGSLHIGRSQSPQGWYYLLSGVVGTYKLWTLEIKVAEKSCNCYLGLAGFGRWTQLLLWALGRVHSVTWVASPSPNSVLYFGTQFHVSKKIPSLTFFPWVRDTGLQAQAFLAFHCELVLADLWNLVAISKCSDSVFGPSSLESLIVIYYLIYANYLWYPKKI
jgi:hypothetical protein